MATAAERRARDRERKRAARAAAQAQEDLLTLAGRQVLWKVFGDFTAALDAFEATRHDQLDGMRAEIDVQIETSVDPELWPGLRENLLDALNSEIADQRASMQAAVTRARGMMPELLPPSPTTEES